MEKKEKEIKLIQDRVHNYLFDLKYVKYVKQQYRFADAVLQLSSRLPRPLSSFPYATEFFCLPAFHFWRDSAFGHRPVRLIFEILPSTWGSQTCYGFGNCSPGFGCCSPVFCVRFIKFWESHAFLLLSLKRAGALLSSLVYTANMCSGQVTLL
jgi:hypothetical protein